MPAADLLIDLLDYIEQIEKLKHKPAYTVPTDIFIAYQNELKGLPSIEFNVQAVGDDSKRISSLAAMTFPLTCCAFT